MSDIAHPTPSQVADYMRAPEQDIAESSIDDNMYELDEMLAHLYRTAAALDKLAEGTFIGAIPVKWNGDRQWISMLAPAAFRYIAKKIDRTATWNEETGDIERIPPLHSEINE